VFSGFETSCFSPVHSSSPFLLPLLSVAETDLRPPQIPIYRSRHARSTSPYPLPPSSSGRKSARRLRLLRQSRLRLHPHHQPAQLEPRRRERAPVPSLLPWDRRIEDGGRGGGLYLRYRSAQARGEREEPATWAEGSQRSSVPDEEQGAFLSFPFLPSVSYLSPPSQLERDQFVYAINAAIEAVMRGETEREERLRDFSSWLKHKRS
jgi:hypothetical protein